MLTAPAIFNAGHSYLLSVTTCHAHLDPFAMLTSKRNQAATPFLLKHTTCPVSEVNMPTTHSALCSQEFHPNTNSCCNNQATPQVTYPCFVPMAPTSVPILLLLLCWDLFVFPGSSSVLPTPLLLKQLPYVYKCLCNPVSTNVTTNTPSAPLSHSSIAIHHALPVQRFDVWSRLLFNSSCQTSTIPCCFYG
jgi:hypothetical protein